MPLDRSVLQEHARQYTTTLQQLLMNSEVKASTRTDLEALQAPHTVVAVHDDELAWRVTPVRLVVEHVVDVPIRLVDLHLESLWLRLVRRKFPFFTDLWVCGCVGVWVCGCVGCGRVWVCRRQRSIKHPPNPTPRQSTRPRRHRAW